MDYAIKLENITKSFEIDSTNSKINFLFKKKEKTHCVR